MVENNSKKISELAKNLKDLHLAASTEEAYERAKEILQGNKNDDQNPSISEMAESDRLLRDIGNVDNELETLDSIGKAIFGRLQNIQEKVDKLKKINELETLDVPELLDEINTVKKKSEEIEWFLSKAEKIQAKQTK